MENIASRSYSPRQCWSELFELFGYSNSEDRIVVFDIRSRSIFKTRIYSVISIQYSVFGPNLLFGPTLEQISNDLMNNCDKLKICARIKISLAIFIMREVFADD